MIPSRNWFPSSLAERAAWMQNFTTQLAILGPLHGIGPTKIQTMEQDNEFFQWIAQLSVTVDAYQKSLIAYRKEMTEGSAGMPEPELPALPTYPAVIPATTAGIFERIDGLVRLMRASDKYGTEDGQSLGIIPSNPPAPEPETMKPTLKLSAEPGNVVVVEFVRGKSDGIDVQMQLDGSETWENAGKFFKSPAQIVVPSETMAAPRAVKLRARYLHGNTSVGQYSDIAQISSIP